MARTQRPVEASSSDSRVDTTPQALARFSASTNARIGYSILPRNPPGWLTGVAPTVPAPPSIPPWSVVEQVTETLSPVCGEQIVKVAEGTNASAQGAAKAATPIVADVLFRAVRKTIAPPALCARFHTLTGY